MSFEYSDIRERYNDNAGLYDSQRKKLIPCFEDFYSMAVSLIETDNVKPDILDIGAGTGLLSSFILEKIPDAHITLIDISEKMLEAAKSRFKDKAVACIIADYTKYQFGKKYDFVVSSLSIHHLTDKEKRQLYANIYSILKQNGLFINADLVLGSTPAIEALYQRILRYKVENSGLSKEELQSAYERSKLDKTAALEDQINWLKEIGFSDVDCVYKYYNFAVIFGRK